MGKKIGKTIAIVLMGAVLLFNLLTAVFHAADLESKIGWFPLTVLTVETGSMEPVLSTGDLLIDWEAPYESLHPGDIVTFHQGNSLVTHEILRWEGDRLVTKGRANRGEDASIGREEYCAKVIAVIPGAGTALSYMTNPFLLAAAVLILIVLFFGRDILAMLPGKKEETEAGSEDGKQVPAGRFKPVKLLAMLTLTSVLFLTPFLTAAKYTATINAYTSMVTASQYLTSNYMSALTLDAGGQMTGGETYLIEGWLGSAYEMQLNIRNFANDLLYNKEGVDTVFSILAVPVSENGTYKTDYTLKITPADSVQSYPIIQKDEAGDPLPAPAYTFVWPSQFPTGTGTKYGPYVLQGSNNGGKTASFTVNLTTNPGIEFAAGDKIRFQIYACTSQNAEFDIRLRGEFTLIVADHKQFIQDKEIKSSVGTSLVTYTLTTNLVDGSGTRDVIVTWNNTQMYLNEYEKTAFDIRTTRKKNYVPDDGNGHGYIILPLQAYSNIKLQLFKKDVNIPVDKLEITAEEVEEKSSEQSGGQTSGQTDGQTGEQTNEQNNG